MCRFVESIKLSDGEFFRLELHQERMNNAFVDHFPEFEIPKLSELLLSYKYPEKGLYKCRVTFDSIIQSVEFELYNRREIKTLRLVETNIPTLRYKIEDRAAFQEAYTKRDGCDDVLLVRNGLITDCSYSNVAFFDGNNWITPKTPLIYGVNRANLLVDNIVFEQDIKVSDVLNFQAIRLFNAMIQFGEIELKTTDIMMR